MEITRTVSGTSEGVLCNQCCTVPNAPRLAFSKLATSSAYCCGPELFSDTSVDIVFPKPNSGSCFTSGPKATRVLFCIFNQPRLKINQSQTAFLRLLSVSAGYPQEIPYSTSSPLWGGLRWGSTHESYERSEFLMYKQEFAMLTQFNANPHPNPPHMGEGIRGFLD